MSENTNNPTPAFDSLSDQRQVFVLAYLQGGFNATRAAKDAGYSDHTAYSQGSRLLKDVEVAAAVKELLYIHGVTPERLAIDLAEIAHGADVAEFQPLFDGTKTLPELRDDGVDTRLIKQIKATRRIVGKGDDAEPVEDITLVLCDRQAAINKLVDVLGLVTQRQEISGAVALNLPGLDAGDLAAMKKIKGGPE